MRLSVSLRGERFEMDNTKIRNPLSRSVVVWAMLTFLGTFGIFAPSIFGMDGLNGGFAISFICIVFAITALVVTFMYARLSKNAGRLLSGDALAHWSYTPEEWEAYRQQESPAIVSGKKKLFITVAIFFAIAIVIMPIFDNEDGWKVSAMMLVILAIIALAAWLSARIETSNIKKPGEVFIGRDGLLLNRQLHMWKGWGAELEDAVIEDGNVPVIRFEYSAPSGRIRADYTVRVPIPKGQMDKARDVVTQIVGVDVSSRI
jgi:hypothetical protein